MLRINSALDKYIYILLSYFILFFLSVSMPMALFFKARYYIMKNEMQQQDSFMETLRDAQE